MSKFGKRIKKFVGTLDNCLVVGQGFGKLSEILETFNTVFLIDENPSPIKAKNLIFRESFEDISAISEISVIFFDRNQVDKLSLTVPLWYRQKPHIIIEGELVIERELSKDLYQHGYRAVELQGTHHIWKLQQ